MSSLRDLPPPPALVPSILDRALGCFVGLAIGDAVGTTAEDLPFDPLRLHTDPDEGQLNPRLGRWTGPTAMALALADALIDPGGYSSHGFMTRLGQWQKTGRFAPQRKCVGIGRSTYAAIQRFIGTGEVQFAPNPQASAGTGSLVRVAPVALHFLHQPERAEAVARQQSTCTHAAPEAAEACATFVAQLRQLILAPPSDEGRRLERDRAQMHEAQRGWPSHLLRPRPNGQVSDTLDLALTALHHSRDFDEALTLATGLGGPSSAIGAVAGALAGAAYGFSSIPQRWLNRLAWKNRIRNIAHALLGIASC